MLKSKIKIVYHGSNNSNLFSKKIHVRKGNDQYGPGLYCTNNIKVAKNYGKYIYELEINIDNFITEKTKVDIKIINNIINQNIDSDILLDWDENPVKALRRFKESILNGSYIETLLNLWKNLFNLNNDETINAFVQNGINGTILKISKGITYYIIYNEDSIINYEII